MQWVWQCHVREWAVSQRVLQRHDERVPMQQVRFVRVRQVQERRVLWLLEHGVLGVLQPELRH